MKAMNIMKFAALATLRLEAEHIIKLVLQLDLPAKAFNESCSSCSSCSSWCNSFFLK
jgi:hypothetical protein